MSKHAAALTRVVPDQLVAQLHAATGELAATTLDDLGMREIARRAGIPRATLYYHFGTKDDLVASLAALLEDPRHEVAVAVLKDGPIEDRLRSVVEAQVTSPPTPPSVSSSSRTSASSSSSAASVRASRPASVTRCGSSSKHASPAVR